MAASTGSDQVQGSDSGRGYSADRQSLSSGSQLPLLKHVSYQLRLMRPEARTRSKVAARRRTETTAARRLTEIIERCADRTPDLEANVAIPRQKASAPVDPVRQVIGQLKKPSLALEKALMAMIRAEQAVGADVLRASDLTVSRWRASDVVWEFSTSSPRRKQTIKVLVIGENAYLQLPISTTVVRQLRMLAPHEERCRIRVRSPAPKRRKPRPR